MQQIVAIDTGRATTKVATHNKQLSFKSIVGDWQVRNLSFEGEWEVEINSEKYFISDLAESESIAARKMTTKSKIHLESKVCILSALAMVAEEEYPHIFLGVPVDQFNQEIKMEMLNLLKGEYYVKINGQLKHLFIDDITICPEGAGTFHYSLAKYPFLENSKVRILDIGSRTVNMVVVNNKKFISRDSGTLNYGALMLEETSLTQEQLSMKIIADLSKKWMEYDQKSDVFLLTGGGSTLLEKWLKPNFSSCKLVEDPIMSNVLGFLKMAEIKIGEKSKWQKQTAK